MPSSAGAAKRKDGARRSKSQPQRRTKSSGRGGFHYGPDDELRWDATISPPTVTAASAMAGYGGFVPGVYSENVCGLATPLAGQRAAYVLNRLERKAEEEGINRMELKEDKVNKKRNGNTKDRRNQGQSAKPLVEEYMDKFNIGPDRDLTWDAGVSPPTITAARALPGYGGFVPGVYSENVIGLVTPKAGQHAAHLLNSLERRKEEVAMAEIGSPRPRDLEAPIGDARGVDMVRPVEDRSERYMIVEDGMNRDVADAESVASLKSSKLSKTSSAGSQRSADKRKTKSKSQPANVRNGNRDSDWMYMNGKKVFAVRPDADLRWDGTVSPTTVRACNTPPGYSGHKPGVYSENVISLGSTRSTQRAAAMLNDLERDVEGNQQLL